MASGWTDLLHGKASIYSLDPSTKQWSDSGGSGQLTMFQSDQYPQDVRLKWSKHSKAISWRLLNGVLKSKGERSWVLKGFNVLEHKDQILAIRFSDHTISDTFHSHYNSIFPPQNQQQMQIQRPQPQPYQPPPKTQPQRPVADWECAVCTFKNNKSKTICSMCGLSIDASFKASDKIKSKKSKKGSKQWTCGKCTFVNPSGKTCGVCGAKKPKRKASGANWICQMCTLQNDAKSTRCAACHAQKLTDPPQHSNAVNPMMNAMGMQPPLRPQHAMQMPPTNVMVGEGMMPTGVASYGMQAAVMMMVPAVNINGSSTSKPEFERVAQNIAQYNKKVNTLDIFATLRSVTKKLLKDDIRYRTLDTTNPIVIEKLVGFDGVLDFLLLLGFESDPMGMKLICEPKPSKLIVRNAVEVLSAQMKILSSQIKARGSVSNKSDMEHIHDAGGTQGQDDDDDLKSKKDDTEGDPVDADTLTLEQIILWSTHEKMRDNESMETLIATHKTITDSVSLLKQLKKRFFVAIPRELANDEEVKEFREGVQKLIQLKVIKALRDWMKKYWEEDFSTTYSDDGHQMYEEVSKWIRQIRETAASDSAAKWMKPWADTLLKEFERFKDKGSKDSHNVAKMKRYKITHLLDAEDTDLLDVILSIPDAGDLYDRHLNISMDNCDAIADQVTLMDFQMFSGIEPRECIGQCWKKANSRVMAPHILGLIQQFNHLTLFVQMQIILQKSLKERSHMMKCVVAMGQRFKRLRNYNSLCAIYSALNSAPIHRLKACWKRLPHKYMNCFKSYKRIFSREFNHQNLRRLFNNSPAPSIPHIGLFLQDLVFIDDGNSNKIKIENFKQHGHMVNFSKCVRIYERCKTIRLYQMHPYIGCDDHNIEIQSDYQLQNVLLKEFKGFNQVTEEHIWDMSTEIKKQDEKDAKKQIF
eukprot:1160617_1